MPCQGPQSPRQENGVVVDTRRNVGFLRLKQRKTVRLVSQWRWAVGLALTLTPNVSCQERLTNAACGYSWDTTPLLHCRGFVICVEVTGIGAGYDGYFPTGLGAKEAGLNKRMREKCPRPRVSSKKGKRCGQ